MSNNIDITLAANANEVERALNRMGSVINSQRQKLEQLSEAGKRGSRQTASGFANAGRSVASTATQVAGSLTGITSAATGLMMMAQSLKKEWVDLKRRQNDALDTTLDVAAAVRATRDAFTEDATLKESGLEARIIKASEKTGARPVNIAKTLQTVFSAKSDATAEQAVLATEQAYRLDRQNEEKSTALAAASLDVQKFSGATDARVNLGFVQNVQEAARITDIKAVSENLIPAIVKMKKFGDTLEQGAEIGTALTQLSTDPQGATSGNALVAMGAALMNFVPDTNKRGQLVGKDRKGNEIVIPEDQFKKYSEATSTMERVAVMQKNRELREAFIGGNSFRKTHEESIFGLLRGGETERRVLEATKRTIKGVQTPEEQAYQTRLYEAEVASKNAGVYQQSLNMQEESQARIERSRLRRTAENPAASARRVVRDTLNEIGLKESISRDILDFVDEESVRGGENPFDVAIKRLETSRTRAGDMSFGNRTSLLVSGGQRAFQQRSDTESVRLLDEAIEKLREEQRRYEEKSNVGSGVQGFVNEASKFGRDPEMVEQTRLLQKIADQGEREGVPRQTERRSSRLSRDSN